MKCKSCKNTAINGFDYCEDHFIKNIDKKVKTTIKKFNLLTEKDKILVAFSGGKDSTVLAYILHKLGYKIEAITINAFIGNYSKQNLENGIKFCEKYGIKLHHVSFKDEFGHSLCYLTSLLRKKGIKINSCTVCGVLRRYLINKACRKMKATKVVLGHNMDDEAQSIMMNFFRGNPRMSARIGPISGLIKDKRFVPRIKPLYLVSEKEISIYSKLHDFDVVYTDCPCSSESYRNSVKEMLNKIEKKNKDIKLNIVNNFLKIQPELKKYYKTDEKLKSCSNCGEPARGELCKTCELLNLVKR